MIESGETDETLISSAQEFLNSAQYDAYIAEKLLIGMRFLLGQ